MFALFAAVQGSAVVPYAASYASPYAYTSGQIGQYASVNYAAAPVAYATPSVYSAHHAVPSVYSAHLVAPSVYSAHHAVPSVYSAHHAVPSVYSAHHAVPSVYAAQSVHGVPSVYARTAVVASPAVYTSPAVYAAHGGATYTAATRGAVHTAPLVGHAISRSNINLAAAPGTY